MKAIQTHGIITGIRSKVDKSLGLTMATPELTAEEKAEFMHLQGCNLVCLFKPLDEPSVPVYKIDREIEGKTPGQRLRAVLYVLWEQSGSKDDFDGFYKTNMGKIIDKIKEQLD